MSHYIKVIQPFLMSNIMGFFFSPYLISSSSQFLTQYNSWHPNEPRNYKG